MKTRMMLLRLTAAVIMTAVAPVGLCERICIEAETAENLTAPMIIVGATTTNAEKVKAASGDAYLEIPEGSGNPPKVNSGSAVFRFTVEKDGDFILWCRVWWNGECSNSFTMQIDDSAPFAFGQDGTYKAWHWVKAPPNLKCLKLTKGEHVLIVSNREDGVKLDQILLTTDRKYVPVDVETPSGIRSANAESK